MNKLIRESAEKILENELNKLLPSQISFFHKIYGDIKSITDEELDWAIEQCQRTLEKNIKLNRVEKSL